MTNHVALFEGASCLWCVIQELFSLNNYNAMPTGLATPKQLPSLI